MRKRSLLWFALSVACFIGAYYFWQLGNEWKARRSVTPEAGSNRQSGAEAEQPITILQFASTAPVDLFVKTPGSNQPLSMPESRIQLQEKYRLRNTTRTAGELVSDPMALLLANAHIDVRMPLNLGIPERLRAKEDPGAYLVQSRGPITDGFRSQLNGAGATIVSYFPNNAYLVQANPSVAQRLRGSPGVQAVIAYEPYYKLDVRLLDAVLGGRTPVPEALNAVVYNTAVDQTLEAFAGMGAEILAEAATPFGRQYTIRNVGDIAAVAALPGVGNVEGFKSRVLTADFARQRIGVVVGATNANNYLGLSGSNIMVAVNDSGVNGSHPDLLGRVFGPASTNDPNGHGTHVAGIIAGNGSRSTTVSNAAGSFLPAVDGQFRGIAPLSTIWAMSTEIDRTDLNLQESGARTNVLISNNSWGYGDTAYDIASASFDAAVRDSLPGVTGSRGVTYVFSAGNDGGGDDNGLNGRAQSVLSPANAKNVISVGAIEMLRSITNEVELRDETNAVWLAETDSNDQVAAFSARGNTGIGVEGDFGRFKPDVVAPGVFLVSTRSPDWDEAAYYNPTSFVHEVRADQLVEAEGLQPDSVYVDENAVELIIRVFNTRPAVAEMPIYARLGDRPDTGDPSGINEIRIPPATGLITDADWFFAVGNPTNVPVRYDVEIIKVLTNELGNYFEVLSNLNTQLGDEYRYESGTSMAAPVVSGMLALIADYFTNRLGIAPPSPALMKAMLINGARPVNPIYDLDVKKDGSDNRNYQGWGLINLTNSVPSGLRTNDAAVALGQLRGTQPSPMIVFEQNPTNALTTAQRRTMNVAVATNALTQTLRMTLVWTDPPGNPAAGIKLVNDLDLIVTNLDSGLVYFGNDFVPGGNGGQPWSTNAVPAYDVVNNVENVFIPQPLGTNYSITVLGRSVNVNAVTAHTNQVAQDYALVISVGNGAVSNALTITEAPQSVSFAFTNVTYMTNQFAEDGGETNDEPRITGGMLLNQHVGANSPLIGNRQVPLPMPGTTVWGPLATNGVLYMGTTNQWHFYVLTNTESFQYAAFVTFLPPTLSTPRMGTTNYFNVPESTRVEADIDMYVSTDPRLLSLDETVIASPNTSKALSRFGTEVIALTNAVGGAYYIGIHAPDHQAAEYAFFGGFSEEPFSEDDGTGITMRGIPVPAPIPDGFPDDPGIARVLAICVQPIDVRRVIVTNLTITHTNLGDLVGNLSHNRKSVVLHNHRPGSGVVSMMFEDNEENNPTLAQRSDGPGSLRDFVGERGEGLWLLTELDSSPGATGRVNRLRVRLDRAFDSDGVVDLTIQPNSFGFTFFDVPVEATNFTVSVVGNTLPLELYVRRDEFPSRTVYDYFMPLPPVAAETTNTLTIDTNSVPPLQSGRYFIGIFNPNDVAQSVRVVMKVKLDVRPVATIDLTKFGPEPLPDDAVMYSTNNVPFDRRIARVDVGVAIQHARISDLALTLVAPNRKRILLFENRGGTSGNLGNIEFEELVQTNLSEGTFVSATNLIPIAGIPSGVLVIDFDFLTVPDSIDVYYGTANIFSSGLLTGSGTLTIPFGPGLETVLRVVVNKDNNPNNPGTIWRYVSRIVAQTGSYFVFSENTNFAHVPIKFALPPFREGPSTVPAGIPVVAGPVLSPVNGHYYYLFDNSTWTQAEAWANALGGHLATVRSAAEDTWLNNTFRSYGGVNRNLWIGLRSFANNPTLPVPAHMANFVWISGETSTYRNWFPGEPNNGGGALAQDFGFIDFFYGGRWQDAENAAFVTGKSEGQYGIGEVTSNVSFNFPEESLEELRGDNALGEWKLEVLDNRVGGTGTNTPPPVLVAWQLRFVFDREVADGTQLLHDVPVTNSIPPCGMQVYRVDVPVWARFATNTLISSTLPVDVFFTTNSLPTTNGPIALSGTSGIRVLSSTNGTLTLPQIVPGGRYYIGVRNPCDSATNAIISFKVEFDIRALQNGVPVTSTNTDSTVPQYFFFDVSTNATAAMFRLTNMSGNFDLVARRGGPLPTLGNNQYGSFNPGTVDEQIVIFTNSTPFALTPGRWYLGVFNRSFASNVFTIVASEFTNNLAGIVTLTNGIPYLDTVGAGSEEYYRYVVSNTAARVQFEVNGPDGDVALVVNRGFPLPSLGDFDYLSDNPFLNDELIIVTTNSSPVVLAPGEWFLTVVNMSGLSASYSVKATEWTVTGQPIVLTNIVYGAPMGGNPGQFCATWNSLPGVPYHVQGTTDLASTNWVAISPTIVATDFTTTYCVPVTNGIQFLRVVEGISVNLTPPPPSIRITPESTGLRIQWAGLAESLYQVQWTTNLPVSWVPFVPNLTSTNTPPPHSFTNGVYSFFDDGTQPPPPAPPTKFYRVIKLP